MEGNHAKHDSKALVSVIIPAYNVELYIEKCVQSLVEQTYQNIEILVVDDGATDNTGALADALAKTDPRIKVIHKENAGVSEARNTGIAASKGEYLVFVDGDDYLAQDYVAYMMDLVNQTGAEFCLSTHCYTQKGEAQTEPKQVRILQKEDATALLLSPAVIVGCWNKIFKKSLLTENNVYFSSTLFYGEGLSFITTMAQLSNCVGVGNRKVYYYRRNNETSATTKFNINKMYNGEKALTLIGDSLTVKNQKVDTMLTLHKSLFCLGAVVKLKANGLDKTYASDYKRWRDLVRTNSLKLLSNKDVSLYRKLMLMGGWICPGVMSKLDMARRKRISDNSVEN